MNITGALVCWGANGHDQLGPTGDAGGQLADPCLGHGIAHTAYPDRCRRHLCCALLDRGVGLLGRRLPRSEQLWRTLRLFANTARQLRCRVTRRRVSEREALPAHSRNRANSIAGATIRTASWAMVRRQIRDTTCRPATPGGCADHAAICLRQRRNRERLRGPRERQLRLLGRQHVRRGGAGPGPSNPRRPPTLPTATSNRSSPGPVRQPVRLRPHDAGWGLVLGRQQLRGAGARNILRNPHDSLPGNRARWRGDPARRRILPCPRSSNLGRVFCWGNGVEGQVGNGVPLPGPTMTCRRTS